MLEISSNVELRTLKLTNKAEVNTRPLRGATIVLYNGSTIVKQVTSDARGDFSIMVPPDGDFMIVVSYPDCNSKKFLVSTKGVPADYDKEGWDPSFPIGGFIMAKPLHGIDYSALQQPMARVSFKQRGKVFDDDEDYTDRVLESLKQIKSNEDVLIARFLEAVQAGDAALKKPDCPLAKQMYENALKLIPNEEYPIAQLAKVGDCLKEKEKQDQLAAEKAAKEKAEAEKLKKVQQERIERERAEAERLAREKEQAAQRRLEEEKLAKEMADAEAKRREEEKSRRLAGEARAEAEKEKKEMEKAALEKVTREKAAEEAKQKAAVEKLAGEKAEAEAREKEANEKLGHEKEKAAQERKAAAEKMVREKQEAAQREKEAAEKLAKIKAEEEAKRMAAAEKLEKEKMEDQLRRKAAGEKVQQANRGEATVTNSAADVETEGEKSSTSPIIVRETESSPGGRGGRLRLRKKRHSVRHVIGTSQYEEAITQADDHFRNKEYDKAKLLYDRALDLKPLDAHASSRLDQIKAIQSGRSPE